MENKISEENEIKINNPKDFPFGPLSNFYRHDMIIDGKRWMTVSNYVLSNMLFTPLFKIIIQNASVKGDFKNTIVKDKIEQLIINQKRTKGFDLTVEEIDRIKQNVLQEVSLQKLDIQQLYQYYLGQEYIAVCRRAIERAYTAKLADKKIVESLIKSENRPIYYISNNSVLGVGNDGNGLNYIGKILMQLRHNIKRTYKEKEETKKKAKEEKFILDCYRVINVLQKEVAKLNDLSEYLGKNPSEILDHYFDKYGDQSLETLFLDDEIRDYVMDLYERGFLDIAKKEKYLTGYIVLSLRKENLGKLQIKIKNKIENIIIEKYTEINIKNRYPNMEKEDVKTASKQLSLAAPNREAYENLKQKLVQLYWEDKMEKSITKKIKKAIEKIPRISDEEVKKAQQIFEPDINDEDSFSSVEEEKIAEKEKETFQREWENDEERKKYLLEQLKRFTDKDLSNLSVQKLSKKFYKYLKGEKTSEKARWIVSFKKPNLKLVVLAKVSGEKPDEKYIEKLVDEYNKDNKDYKLSKNKVSVYLEQTDVKGKERVEQYNEEKDEKPEEIVDYSLKPLEIFPQINENNEFKHFSPIYEKTFLIDGFKYPSASIYLTAMLLTQTGYDRIKDTYKRGISLKEARAKIVQEHKDGEDVFYPIDRATAIYEQYRAETYTDLISKLTKYALKKKFSDNSMASLLILTGKSKLIWDVQDDILLGAGTEERKGRNLCGEMLMEIRDNMFKENQALYRYAFRPLPKEIDKGIEQDSFLNSWVKLLLNDMSKTVYKIQNYLKQIGKQDEEIDSRLVNHVLKLFYQPCKKFISIKDVDVVVPEYFIQLVKYSDGMLKEFPPEFQSEINSLRKEKEEFEQNFSGYKPKKVQNEPKENLSSQQIIRKLEEFKNRIPKPKQHEIENFERTLISQFFDQDKKKVELSLEDKQRIEWEKFMNTINKPEKSLSEIQNIINKAKNDKKLKTESEKKEVEKELWKKLTKPKLSEEERKKRVAEFKQVQDRERKEYYGINDKEKTEDEKKKYKEMSLEFDRKIFEINKKKKDYENDLNLNIYEVAKSYWTHLTYMINMIIANTKTISVNDLQKIIVKSENYISQAKNCQNIVNIKDREDNCIASALANILSSIQAIKYQYSEKIPFGKHDIDLSLSILLNKELSLTELKEDEELEEYSEEETEDKNIIDEEDAEDFNDYNEEEEEREEEIFEFGFNQKEYIEQYRIILKQIYGKEEITDELVSYFIETIELVKKSSLSEKIKTNRINFFATLII